MKALERIVVKSVILVVGAGMASAAFAGGSAGSITTVPGASGIPTMGGGALMMLSVLMAVIAVRVMRSSKNKTVNMGVALAAALSLGSGVGGMHLISEAVAAGVIITNPNGQTRNIFEGFNPVFNDSGTLQRVTDISLNSGCTQVFESERNGGFELRINGGNVGTCSVSPSTELPDGSTCEIIVDCGGLHGGNNGGNGGLMNGGIGDT